MKYIVIILLFISHFAYGLDAEGMWVGTYSYSGEISRKVNFVMVLKKNGMGYSGKTLENNSFGEEGADCLIANVTGEIDDQGKVKLFHKYNGDGNQSHLIVYIGVLKQGVMEGEWTISEDWKGKFSAKLIEPAWRYDEELEKIKKEKDAKDKIDIEKSAGKM